MALMFFVTVLRQHILHGYSDAKIPLRNVNAVQVCILIELDKIFDNITVTLVETVYS
jgi:hypothetical protein